jgi:hypothetical protein
METKILRKTALLGGILLIGILIHVFRDTF